MNIGDDDSHSVTLSFDHTQRSFLIFKIICLSISFLFHKTSNAFFPIKKKVKSTKEYKTVSVL